MQLDRSPYSLTFSDDFESPQLDSSAWIPHYLPQWSTPERSEARFDITDSTLRLRIDDDQLPWSLEYSDGFRVSNLQTGVRAAAVGNSEGQHRHQEGLVVRTAIERSERLFTPTVGIVEARVRASNAPGSMVALWLIGFEDSPADSGELCVFEIFASEMSRERALVGVGVKPHHDPRLTEHFAKIPVSFDATDFHTYSVEWMPQLSRFYIDDELVLESPQSPEYPMQLMLDIFEWRTPEHIPGRTVPTLEVDFVRGWSRGD